MILILPCKHDASNRPAWTMRIAFVTGRQGPMQDIELRGISQRV
jgi:hypothetical protein